ncbi:MAG: elongation factor P [Planctomycetes bacterium]|nr:elongation factor P [Planctomycetota bacterium]
MIKATEMRKGMVIKVDDRLVRITDYTHITPGNLRGIVHIKYKDIQTGSGGQKRLRPEDKLDTVFLDKRQMEYLYEDQGGYVFMDQETYEQPTIAREMLEELMPYILPNSTVDILFYEGEPVTIELPPAVVMTVQETEPAVRGDTVQNVVKPATTETGLAIKVPNHIKEGDKVKVDTRTGDFMERVNE